MDMHIRFDNVTVHYGPKPALCGVTLEIPRRQIFAIIGPANAGKTTLLKCINRTIDFVPAANVQGEVHVDNENVYRLRNVYSLRRRIGMVFPLPVGLPLSVYENVAYAPRRAGLHDREQLDALVEKCLRQAMLWDEVKDRLDASALGLSGGQQQRLCIARTIAVRPEVILFDEPTSALDPISTLKIEELIDELKRDFTIVIVTHNMQQAARCADQVAFFYLGELIEVSGAAQMFTAPKHPKTQEYITGRFG